MDPPRPPAPIHPHNHPVLGDKDVLPQILLKLGSTRSTARCARAHRCFRDQIRDPVFAPTCAKLQDPATIGFLVEIGADAGKLTWLIDTAAAEGDDTADAFRTRIIRHSFAHEAVLCSRRGVLLVDTALGYSIMRPCTGSAEATHVAPRAPSIPKDTAVGGANTYGQFVLLRNAIPGGMAFFIEDPSTPPERTLAGVSFGPSSPVSLHLSIIGFLEWENHSHELIQAPTPVILFSKPQCILVDDRIHMSYALGVIVTFVFSTCKFTSTSLPQQLHAGGTPCETDYVIGEHRDGDLMLVHSRIGFINTYLLHQEGDEQSWTHLFCIPLIDQFINQLGLCFWKRLFKQSVTQGWLADIHPLQIRCASQNGSYLLLTLGNDGAFFVFDIGRMKVSEIGGIPEGKVGNVFTLTEPWPPKFD